jgi:hypothetical protein
LPIVLRGKQIKPAHPFGDVGGIGGIAFRERHEPVEIVGRSRRLPPTRSIMRRAHF